jgi:hypothetical protein
LLRNCADKIFRVKVTVARSKVRVRRNVTLAHPLMKMSPYCIPNIKCLAQAAVARSDKFFRVKVTVARSKVKVLLNMTLAQPLMKMSLYTEYKMPSSSRC